MSLKCLVRRDRTLKELPFTGDGDVTSSTNFLSGLSSLSHSVAWSPSVCTEFTQTTDLGRPCFDIFYEVCSSYQQEIVSFTSFPEGLCLNVISGTRRTYKSLSYKSMSQLFSDGLRSVELDRSISHLQTLV